MTGLPAPAFDLDEPGTILFTARRAYEGRALNRFALSLRLAENRERFLADPRGYAGGYHLRPDEVDMVEARDWTGLLLAGGHVLALLKVAAALGGGLWDIGAHTAGVTRDELIASCPRRVAAVPGAG